MPLRKAYVLPLAGLIAVAGTSCASAQHPRPAEQAANAGATGANESLTQAQQRVDAAHQDVVRYQQQLADAQRRESDERGKLRQLQQQANPNARPLDEQASQAKAAPAPLAAGQAGASGERSISGHLLQATPRQLVLQSQDGQTMTLDLNDQTRVLVGGELRSAADLQQGADARVAYEDNNGRPTAIMVQVPRADSSAAQPPGGASPSPGASAAPDPNANPGSRAMPVPGTESRGTGY
jgi:hypothetical protein